VICDLRFKIRDLIMKIIDSRLVSLSSVLSSVVRCPPCHPFSSRSPPHRAANGPLKTQDPRPTTHDGDGDGDNDKDGDDDKHRDNAAENGEPGE